MSQIKHPVRDGVKVMKYSGMASQKMQPNILNEDIRLIMEIKTYWVGGNIRIIFDIAMGSQMKAQYNLLNGITVNVIIWLM